MKLKSFEVKKLLIFIYLNYQFINFVILNGQFKFFNEIENSTKIYYLLFAVTFLYIILNIPSRFILFCYPISFFIFSILNIIKIPIEYFWTVMPDSRTYSQLGTSLLNCGKLAIECSDQSFLIFPILQPFISGILKMYFYDYSPYIYSIFTTISIVISIKIIKKYDKSTQGFGIFYIMIHSLIFELTPLIISEITFTLLILLSIFLLITNNESKLKNLFYSLSLLIRPVGIALLPIIFLYTKSKKNLFLTLTTVLLIAASFNFFTVGEFKVSEFNIDSQQDGFVDNENYFDYIKKIFLLDTDEKVAFLNFFTNNTARLYGETSNVCVFDLSCTTYNPIYNTDGTVSDYFANSRLGNFISSFLILIFKIQAPLGQFIYFLPFLIFISIFFFKEKNIRFYTVAIISLIFPSILTAEYGNRWSFTILFLTGILIETILTKVKKLYYGN